MTKQRREGEANRPQGQRPARVSRRGLSWAEFIRLADEAVVAIVGADMINPAEPRACGHSCDARRRETEPKTDRMADAASNAAGNRSGRMQDNLDGFQPYRGELALRNGKMGWKKRGQDLMAICHNARKGRYTEATRLNRSRLCSTRPVSVSDFAVPARKATSQQHSEMLRA